MKLSARNVFEGTITEVKPGTVNTVVKVDIGGGVVITSMITADAAQELAAAPGRKIHAVIKASDVILAAE